MASVYVAIPSPEKLEKNTDSFLAAMKTGSKQPQAQVFTEIAFSFLDVMLEALFYGPTRQIEHTNFRKKLIDGLGSLIEKTSHTLIKSVISKLSNDELRPLQGFVEERRIKIDGVPHIAFPLTPHFTTRFEALHEATMSGNRSVDEQVEIMTEFVDASLDYLFKKPIDLLKLGFIARKSADLGYSAIRSMAHSTIRKLATDTSLEENQRLSQYFYSLMKEGPDYKGN